MTQIEDVIENDETLGAGEKAFLIDTFWMLRRVTAKRDEAAGHELVIERLQSKAKLAIVEQDSSYTPEQRQRLTRLINEHRADLGDRIEEKLRAG